MKFGYKLKTEGTKGATARSLNKLMSDCEGKPENNLIQMVALRAMMKAKYSVHNIGHFGLAFEYYTHFTSPIRRYPDTMVHRLLTKYADGAEVPTRNITKNSVSIALKWNRLHRMQNVTVSNIRW